MRKEALKPDDKISASILMIRGLNVVLDTDLALLFGVETKRLNERIKRNADRFGEKYAFRLTAEEFSALRSQSATSKGRGGRRYLPLVFTEHGVVMAATVLDSEKAIEASKLIVEVFVKTKRQPASESLATDTSIAPNAVALPETRNAFTTATLWGEMGVRLATALNHVLDTVIDQKKQTTIREEAQNLISESIKNLKERLKKTGLENEEMAAQVTKLLAEAEKEKSIAAKTRAEAEALEFSIIVRKLRLLIEAHRAMTENKLEGFLNVLKELGEGSTSS